MGEVSIDEVLDGFTHNAKMYLSQLETDEFVQALGLWAGLNGDDTTALFSKAEAAMTQRYLMQHDVLCTQVAFTMNGQTSYHLLLSNSERGLHLGVKEAKKTARRFKAVMQVVVPDRNLN